MKHINLLALCFLCVCVPGYCEQEKDPTPIHSATTIPPNSRFEIVQSTIAARWLFRLDRQTGAVFQIVRNASDDLTWDRMAALEMPTPPPSGVHYEIFLSGIAAKFMFLMNLDTGKTWQLQSSTDEKTKETNYTWVPLH